ncbi:helix-turn-helix domain-containing protein, partial [Calditerricola satsumensis]|uniref:helix-turn-helix domain-containing protein n=1 Tax=Calditerricola satsumensis TaxID=373054 RepID=UPI001C450588
MLYEQLEVLAAIVEEGSMNRAADRLRITQPALSRAIKKLEERFGTAFFERRGKQLVLTPAAAGPTRRPSRWWRPFA